MSNPETIVSQVSDHKPLTQKGTTLMSQRTIGVLAGVRFASSESNAEAVAMILAAAPYIIHGSLNDAHSAAAQMATAVLCEDYTRERAVDFWSPIFQSELGNDLPCDIAVDGFIRGIQSLSDQKHQGPDDRVTGPKKQFDVWATPTWTINLNVEASTAEEAEQLADDAVGNMYVGLNSDARGSAVTLEEAYVDNYGVDSVDEIPNEEEDEVLTPAAA